MPKDKRENIQREKRKTIKDKDMELDYTIYTKGGYSLREKKGAYAFAIVQGDELVRFDGTAVSRSTNNRCALQVIIDALDFVPDDSKVRVITDSQYAVGMFGLKWKASANEDLILEHFHKVMKKRLYVEYQWVSSSEGDEVYRMCCDKCDEMADFELMKAVASEIQELKNPKPNMNELARAKAKADYWERRNMATEELVYELQDKIIALYKQFGVDINEVRDAEFTAGAFFPEEDYIPRMS